MVIEMKLVEYSKSSEWKEKGYVLPSYDRDALVKKTVEEPTWIHFGAGNIFRAFPAAVLENMLNSGAYDRGVIVSEGFDTEIIDKAYAPYDSLSLLVVLKADGSIDKRVIGSVTESLKADVTVQADWNRLKEIFVKPSLQMVSFTITEKGYSVIGPDGQPHAFVKRDLDEKGLLPDNIMGKICALLYERFKSGAMPIAMVSMDNCSHNGDKLKAAVLFFAEQWLAKGLVEPEFIAYLKDECKVSFPWSMIDKITPRPDETVRKMLTEDGFEDTELIITSRNTYTAPFVNAEETEYLVIEDSFPNGRPPMEKGGILFTKREVVDQVEKMKVCTCLNPLHTALAIYGCLLGYELISEEMKDEELRTLITRVAYEEAMPVVVNPGIIKPEDFLNAVLTQRLPNPFMPDTPQRIATDTSQKLAIRFGETIKAYIASKDLDVMDLKLIPLVFAGWLRYLMAVDDEGNKFTLSPDPLLDTVCPYVAQIRLGGDADVEEALKNLLSDKTIFGVDLYEAGLAKRVCGYFKELIAGPGAVRATLKKYVEA